MIQEEMKEMIKQLIKPAEATVHVYSVTVE